MRLPQAKHDALFRLIVADQRRARALLQDCLPAAIATRLDPDSLPEHVDGTAIDGAGRKTEADAILRVRLRDSTRIYVLLEHKSTPDAGTPLQLLRYMLPVWMAELDGGDASDGKLTPIIPVVIYHGQGWWTQSLSVQGMIRPTEGWEESGRPIGHFTVHDLKQIPPLLLCRDPIVRSSLFALAHDGTTTLTEAEENLLAMGIADTELGSYHLLYVMEWFNLPWERLSTALQRIGRDKQEMEALMGTIAESLVAEGEARGKAVGIVEGEARGKAVGIVEGEARGKAVGIVEGEARGKAEAVLQLVRFKFGDIPMDVAARVRNASSDTVDAWLEALLTAEDIDAVFAHRKDH